ncbi:MAG: class B sortase [Bacilli bacterium]|nr:class B sortase [Bacilli bacterium]
MNNNTNPNTNSNLSFNQLHQKYKQNNSNNNYIDSPITINDIPIKEELLLKKVKKTSKKKKKKTNKTILIILLIFFLTIFIFCTIKLIEWNQDNKNTNDTIDNINEITLVEELVDNDNTKLINEPKTQESDYWYYIKFPLIQVNFNELKEKNTDTIAWIQVNNTNINYPIVQTDNNDFYLNHSYDKSTNEAGWVFTDYRNNSNFTDKNTIIYAHSRLDKTMFGSLSKTLKPSWYQNKENHIIKISTPTENSLWQIFSVYTIKEENYYITTNFENDNTYTEFLNTIKDRSKYNFNTTLNTNDTIITLSTCYSDTERTVVHAKKIKQSTRDS